MATITIDEPRVRPSIKTNREPTTVPRTGEVETVEPQTPPADEPTSAWVACFTPAERERMLREDWFAGAAVACILGSIFTMGLILGTVGVLLSLP